jgi:hypothetical protein
MDWMQKLVNGGKVNFWFCISFSPTIRANDIGWFCKKLGDMCRVSGMVCTHSFKYNIFQFKNCVFFIRKLIILWNRYSHQIQFCLLYQHKGTDWRWYWSHVMKRLLVPFLVKISIYLIYSLLFSQTATGIFTVCSSSLSMSVCVTNSHYMHTQI